MHLSKKRKIKFFTDVLNFFLHLLRINISLHNLFLRFLALFADEVGCLAKIHISGTHVSSNFKSGQTSVKVANRLVWDL